MNYGYRYIHKLRSHCHGYTDCKYSCLPGFSSVETAQLADSIGPVLHFSFL